MKIPKDLKPLARQARRNGWRITYAGSGHIRWHSPGGHIITTSSTPRGGRHSDRNARHALRKAGLP